MERAGQQHGWLGCGERSLGHASITLLLHRQHRRQLGGRQHPAVRDLDLRQQCLAYRRGRRFAPLQ